MTAYLNMQRSRKPQFAQKFSESSMNDSRMREQDLTSEGRPINLLKIQRSGKIQINDEALDIIASISQPVGFVSLVGKTRTGKSCLLNRLLHLTGDGFKVDPSTSSCTEGIWMWSQPYANPQNNNLVFFLDTEGTDSLVKDVQNDTKIFTLAVLVSSFFIYNSLGSIDERSINELQMVTALSKQIQTGQGSTQLHNYMPKFLWLLRDFMLEPVDSRGRKITATQYLQNSLNDENSIGKADPNSKKIRQSIVKYFPIRQCLTLVRPVDEEEDIYNMNRLPDSRLRRQFIEGINNLRNKIMVNTGPKTFKEKTVNGQAMALMIESYVDAFNQNKVPNIRSAWEQISQNQGIIAYDKAIQKFQELYRQQFGADEPKGEQIYKSLMRLKEESKRQFQQNTYGNNHEKHARKLNDFLDQKEMQILSDNNDKNQQRNILILNNHVQKLKTRVENGYYMTGNNKQQINADINEVVKKYNSQARGAKKEELISEFVANITVMVLNMKQDNTQQEETKRRMQIMEKEHAQKLKNIQRQQESKGKQLVAEQNANAITDKNKEGRKRRDKEEETKTGCCGGKACQIM